MYYVKVIIPLAGEGVTRRQPRDGWGAVPLDMNSYLKTPQFHLQETTLSPRTPP
jgi:hypothetical protein